jgi:hypothetical protein
MNKLISEAKPVELAIGSRFRRYGPEQERAIRNVEVRESAAVGQMMEAWERFDYRFMRSHEFRYDEVYSRAASLVLRIDYDSRDVELFSIALAEFQDEDSFSWKAGLFLSALINEGKDNGFTIHNEHLDPINHLGYWNEKHIKVIGNTGDNLGRKMKTGSITVDGNAGTGIGLDMQGGRIIVEGGAEMVVGQRMKAGLIIVCGDADSVGACMHGGRIFVGGDAGEVGSYMSGGEISIGGSCQKLGEMKMGKVYLRGGMKRT